MRTEEKEVEKIVTSLPSSSEETATSNKA